MSYICKNVVDLIKQQGSPLTDEQKAKLKEYRKACVAKTGIDDGMYIKIC